MNNAVRYFSKTGNTKKIAQQIAQAAGCEAKTVDEPLSRNVDVLFIGAAVYRAGVADEVIKFINTLTPKRAKKVVLFSTSCLFKRGYRVMKRALKLKGIEPEKQNFYCKGQFISLNAGKPDENDLKNAYDFAKEMCRQK